MVNIWVYDIETSPNLAYTWGLWDQNIGLSQLVEPQGILSFAAHKIGTRGIEVHASWDGYEDMVARLWDIFDDADYLVGYNNINYDDRFVRAAFAADGVPPPSPARSVDLMRTVKNKFKFPSHKLDYVCGALGLDVKADTGGMDTWIGCLNGDPAAQRKMLKYNKQDVKITTQLFERLRPWIDGMNLPLYGAGEGQLSCTRCGSSDVHKRGWAYTTTYRYQRYRCMSCGGWMKHRRSEKLPNNELRNA